MQRGVSSTRRFAGSLLLVVACAAAVAVGGAVWRSRGQRHPLLQYAPAPAVMQPPATPAPPVEPGTGSEPPPLPPVGDTPPPLPDDF